MRWILLASLLTGCGAASTPTHENRGTNPVAASTKTELHFTHSEGRWGTGYVQPKRDKKTK